MADFLAIKLNDHIANLKSGFFCRRVSHHLTDQCARGLVQTKGFRQLTVHRLDKHSQPATTDPPLILQLGNDFHGHINRDRER